MEKEGRLQQYSIHQDAREVVDNFEDRMQRAETLALHIGEHITKTRDQLLQEERVYGKTKLGYNLDMDAVVYQAIYQYESNDSLGELVHRKALEALNKYTRFQLETLLGERFNVLSSTYPLQIQNGEIWSDRMNEPFKNMLIRGQKYREHHGSLEVEREKAEVDGFIDGIEPLLCDPKVPVGTIVLSFSPRGKAGSVYQHNFYDMFIIREDANGKRYVEARRYSSGLALSEYKPKVAALNSMLDIPDVTDDVFWKKQHVRVMNKEYDTPEKLHAFLHRQHDYMSEKQFKYIVAQTQSCIDWYIQTLTENPNDRKTQNDAYDAVLNRADDVWGEITGKSGGRMRSVKDVNELTIYDMRLLADREVRRVMTGCGISGGQEKQDMFKDPVAQMLEDFFGNLFKVSFSVSQFGEDEWFSCECGYKASGPIGNSACPGCNITKEEYAKKTGKPVCA